MEKVRYELDPYNRLRASGGGEGSLKKFRAVLDGRFRTDAGNNLVYHIKAPRPAGLGIPNQVKLKGEWSLTKEHKLRLTLDKSARDTFGDNLTFEGDMLAATGSSLLFSFATVSKNGTRTTYIIGLDGVWKADGRNRLSFHAGRESGRYDILTLAGAWEMDKSHRIIYRYEGARLLRKTRQSRTLTFKGHWDITGPLRLSYILDKDIGSGFEFKVSAGVLKEGSIKYELGAAYGRTQQADGTVRLFGRWRPGKGPQIEFEVEYENGRTGAISFEVEGAITDKDTVLLRLRNAACSRGRYAELRLSRRIFKGEAEAYLRAIASEEESSVSAGAAWRW